MQLTQPPTRLEGMDARAERPVVLVIDDQPAILDLLDYTLALQGYQAVCIANGQEALAWIKNTLHIGRYPMVILLDLHMPVMNGTGFLASLHAQWDAPVPIPPIILLTVDKSDHSHLGCNDVLLKPFRIRDLYERLRRVVSPDGCDAGERSWRESAPKGCNDEYCTQPDVLGIETRNGGGVRIAGEPASKTSGKGMAREDKESVPVDR